MSETASGIRYRKQLVWACVALGVAVIVGQMLLTHQSYLRFGAKAFYFDTLMFAAAIVAMVINLYVANSLWVRGQRLLWLYCAVVQNYLIVRAIIDIPNPYFAIGR